MNGITVSDMKTRLEADRLRYAALPRWKKAVEDSRWWLRYGLNHTWEELRFKVRVRFNRAVHGYDEFDWWEYASNSSRRAVTLLTLLLKKGHGFKCMRTGEHDCWDRECRRLWQEALGDMIFFHTVCGGDYEEGEVPERGDPIHQAWIKTGVIFQNEADAKRYRRGKFYYFKHYEGLWD